ncbi:MAG TPA: alpha/beta fold hydrolase, partial [Edaphobacter sp.]|nr:alpha/beta fold hydrolase [Edaphobacter sp.]
MSILNTNPLWNFFRLRALATVRAGGAEIDECDNTIRRIGSTGTSDTWYREWITEAERLYAAACIEREAGQNDLARRSFTRASTYYRISYLPFFGFPVDPWLIDAFHREAEAFQCAAELSDFPLEAINISYQNSSLQAFWARPDHLDIPRRTIICINDYDSNLHETFCVHGFTAIDRGYNCLVIDGPGQGRELVRNISTIRPDWETVIEAVVDFLLHQPEVDPSAIVLAGWGWGAALTLRAGALENRIAALITGPAMSEPDPVAPIALVPGFLDIENARLSEVEDGLRAPHRYPIMYWKIMRCMVWAHGMRSFRELVQDLHRFEVEPYLSQITVPTLLSAHVKSPL